MDRHKCKLCFRTFPNGRALGGHMKVHLANFPLPPKAETELVYQSDSTPSSSSFSSGEEDETEIEDIDEEHVEIEEEEDEEKEKALVYALRENPKKSFRLADPEFSFAVAVIQDRESETESKNPTRRRTKRSRGKPGTVVGISEINQEDMDLKKAKLQKGSSCESPSEPEPVSSVSYTSPEEDVAMCLMMLSRDSWMRAHAEVEQEVQTLEKKRKGPKDDTKSKRVRGKHQCENCRKTFRSSRALNSHKRICFLGKPLLAGNTNEKIFECPFCFQLFGSGQALGGHKRSHLIGLSSTTAACTSAKNRETFIDLNLPAPPEDDDLSVVSES